MTTDEALIALYRTCLGHHKKPTAETARLFAQNIRSFATHQIRWNSWSYERAEQLVDQVHQLLNASEQA